MPGTLYIVATPLGNLEDITLRAIRILKEVDLIACEDTRHTAKLLAALEIRKSLTSYFDHNKSSKGEDLLNRLHDGQNIALVSDAGTPCISDPGFNLVRAAVEKGIPVVTIPGPSAVVAAVAASGLPTDRFLFLGFLPQKPGKRRKLLQSLEQETATIIFYESPFRVEKTLRLLLELGEGWRSRKAVLAHEMTKIHEGFLRGTIEELLQSPEKIVEKGEWTILIEGAPDL